MYVVIDRIRYYVEKKGEGFPLLLLHGFTGDSSTWTPFCPKWGEHSTLIFPDIIGHGKTESPDKSNYYQIETVANDLKNILDKLGVHQVDVLGYSMGGRLALTFAMLFPERVRKLILESASPGLVTEHERETRRMKDRELAEFILKAGIKPFVDYWEAIPLFSTMNRLSASVKEAIRKQRLRNSPTGLANSLLGMGTGSQPSWWGNLGRITNEVLLLTGEEDEKFCAIAQKMLDEFQNGTWIALKNRGHALHVEEPEKFGTIVSEFLSNT